MNMKLPSESVIVVPIKTPLLNLYNETATRLRLTSPVPSSFVSSFTFPAMEPNKGHKVGLEVSLLVGRGVGGRVGYGVGARVGFEGNSSTKKRPPAFAVVTSMYSI